MVQISAAQVRAYSGGGSVELVPLYEDKIHVSLRGKVSAIWCIIRIALSVNHLEYTFRFSIEIETYYTSDGGHQDNIFNLSNSDARNRVVDLIDVVKDQVE